MPYKYAFNSADLWLHSECWGDVRIVGERGKKGREERRLHIGFECCGFGKAMEPSILVDSLHVVHAIPGFPYY